MNRAEKIRALLAKAARTDNEHEADAYRTTAEELMVKWGVDDAMLAAAGEALSDRITQRLFPLKAEDEAVGYLAMINAICAGMGGLRAIFVMTPLGHHTVPVYVIGFSSDVERFALLWEFVQPQAEAALESFWLRRLASLSPMQYISDVQRGHLRAQFLMSYGNAIGDRLRKEREAVTEKTTGAELAVISRLDKVDRHMEESYPDMAETQMSVQHDFMAEAAGWTGGSSANLRVKSQIGEG